MKYGLIIILLFACATRLLLLNLLPNAIAGDELLYTITAKTMSLTGHDLTGTWNPLSAFLFQYPPGQHQAELPYFIVLPFTAMLPLSLFVARLPFALFSIGIVLLLFAITKKLVGEREAIVVGVLACFNPWLLVIGRTGYEWTIAAFFYLLGLYLLLILKGKSLLITIPVFFSAFYSYIGMKLIFLPLVLLFTFFAWKKNRQDVRWYAGVTLSALCLTGVFGFITLSSSNSRIGDLGYPNAMLLGQEVDSIRRITIETPFTNLFVNKATIYTTMLLGKFLEIFSPSYLFFTGDQFFSLWHGFFYAVDFVFFIVGFGYLWRKNLNTLLFLLSVIVLSTFPHVFHKTPTNFSYHIAFMFPFMLIIIGSGMSWVFRKIPSILTIGIYTCFVGHFLFLYVFQAPLRGYADFPMRIASSYIKRAISQGARVSLYTTSGDDFTKKYQFYTNTVTQPISFDIFSCSQTLPGSEENHVILYETNCGYQFPEKKLTIARLSDGGSIYSLYNDTLCSSHDLQSYPSHIPFSSFRVERLSDEKFCKIYLTRPN